MAGQRRGRGAPGRRTGARRRDLTRFWQLEVMEDEADVGDGWIRRLCSEKWLATLHRLGGFLMALATGDVTDEEAGTD